jgi:flagellar protein FliT
VCRERAGEAPVDEAVLRENLEGLLVVYRMLLEAATNERQSMVEQMGQINQAKMRQRFTICSVKA